MKHSRKFCSYIFVSVLSVAVRGGGGWSCNMTILYVNDSAHAYSYLQQFINNCIFTVKDYDEQEGAADYNNPAAMTPTDMVNNNLEPANQEQPLSAANQRASLCSSSSASESANQRASTCSSTSDRANQRSSVCSNTSSRPPSLELGKRLKLNVRLKLPSPPPLQNTKEQANVSQSKVEQLSQKKSI